jgi:hypothetical protein
VDLSFQHLWVYLKGPQFAALCMGPVKRLQGHPQYLSLYVKDPGSEPSPPGPAQPSPRMRSTHKTPSWTPRLAFSLHPVALVSPAPDPEAARILRLHAHTSRPKEPTKAEAARAVAMLPAAATGSGSGSGANFVRRRTSPARNTSPAGTPARRDSGPRSAAAMASATVETFVTKQLQLLELERDAEVQERRYERAPVPREARLTAWRGVLSRPRVRFLLGHLVASGQPVPLGPRYFPVGVRSSVLFGPAPPRGPGETGGVRGPPVVRPSGQGPRAERRPPRSGWPLAEEKWGPSL